MSFSYGSESPHLAVDDLGQDCFDIVAIPPPRVVRLKPPDIRNPPDVIEPGWCKTSSSAARSAARKPRWLPALSNWRGGRRRYYKLHGPRILDKVPERINQVPGMDVVAGLRASIAEHRMGLPGGGAFREIGEKPVQEWPGPVKQPPRKHAVFNPNIGHIPGPGHRRRASTRRTGCAGCYSMLIDSSMPRVAKGWSALTSQRVSSSTSGSRLGVSP
jgi:hypothetical protein